MENKTDPYQILFPIGWFLGLWGALLWVLFALGLTGVYPGPYHADIMVGGFLFTFATGFLMTAIPRFTGGPQADFWESALAGVLALALVASSFSRVQSQFHEIILVNLIFLAIFALRRFRFRIYDPPPSFLFVGVGIFSGLLGVSLTLAGESFLFGRSAAWVNTLRLGRSLYLQGMMLNLVYGVGSRLIPAILGWGELPTVVAVSRTSSEVMRKPFLKTVSLKMKALGLLMIISFVLEAYLNVAFGRAVRAAIGIYLAVNVWKIHRLPRATTQHALWLWLSCWCLIAGLSGYALVHAQSVHMVHLAFVGGFGLMTIMMATRVTLSHGSREMELERTSKGLLLAGGFILAAAFGRVLAPWSGKHMMAHMAYAAALWLAGLIAWGSAFLRKMVHRTAARSNYLKYGKNA